MLDLNSKDVEQVVKIGKSKYDCEQRETNYRFSIVRIKVNGTNNEEIEAFLDYQIENNKFKHTLIALLYYQSNKDYVRDQKKLQIVLDWLSEVLPVKRGAAGQLYEIFLKCTGNPFDEAPIEKLLSFRNIEDSKKILSFAKELTQECYELHSLLCNNVPCIQDSKYEDKIGYIDKKMKLLDNESTSLELSKIKWKGTQKELGELFKELKENGWIEDFNYKTIKACFTNSDSINQVLKPFTDKKTKKNEYENIYSPKYKAKFHGIPKNESRSK